MGCGTVPMAMQKELLDSTVEPLPRALPRISYSCD